MNQPQGTPSGGLMSPTEGSGHNGVEVADMLRVWLVPAKRQAPF